MLEIATIINALSTVASAVEQIQHRKKIRQEAEQSENLNKRLKELEDIDLEQEQLIGELSRNVEHLAKAIETEIEANRARDARNQRLVYIALTLGLVALVVSLVALLR